MISKLEKPNREKRRIIKEILEVFEEHFWYSNSDNQLWYKFEDRSYSVDRMYEDTLDLIIELIDKDDEII